MRTGAGTAVGVVAELVDVHAALGGGVGAADVVGDGCRARFGGLLEGDGAAYAGVTAEDCDCWIEERLAVAGISLDMVLDKCPGSDDGGSGGIRYNRSHVESKTEDGV